MGSPFAMRRFVDTLTERKRRGLGFPVPLQLVYASEDPMAVIRPPRGDREELNAEERESAIKLDSEAEPDLMVLAQRILRGHPAPWLRRLDHAIRGEH